MKIKRIRRLSASIVMVAIMFLITLVLGVNAITYGAIDISNEHPAITITARNASWDRSASRAHSFIPASSENTFYVLALGNDYRPGVEGHRADAIHLIGINTKEKKASMIDFPRDTNVAIPGHGRSKINAANAYGGSALTAQTLEQLVGVEISYVLEVDFAGFTGLINDLGGIDVTVKQSMHDHNSGSNFSPGVVHMNGPEALSFSRDRHSFGTGDIQRSQNQGAVLIAALAQMKKSKTSVASRFESAAYMIKQVKLTNLSIRDLYMMMELASTIDESSISNVVVPWAGSNTLAPTANALFADFKDNAILDTYK